MIGLKAPGNYSDQFWSNKILVLLCEGLKPNISTIPGFLSPWELLFMHFNPKKGHVQQSRNHINEGFEGSHISKSRSYKLKMKQNNTTELLSTSFP